MNRQELHSMLDLVLEMGERLMSRAPRKAVVHLRNARRESLLAVRALVDHALTRLECEGQTVAAGDGPKAIPVE